MAYETLKSDIQSYVKQNGEGAITGDGLQSILLEIVNTLGTGFKYVGVATPSTSPGTPTENVFYIGGKGIYANFGSTIEVEAYQICVFAYNGSWSKSVINVGSSFDVEDYPAGAAVEFTFYSAETPDGRSIKINKDVSGLSNEPDEAISQWWAAQKERKINLIAGYTIDFDSLDASSPSSLGVFKAIQTGQIIDSFTNATSLIFGTDGGQSVTINKSQLPYTATANLINVKSASGTLSNVSIKVRGSLENMPSYININEIANHPTAYANAAAALADVPEIYRRKGTKVVYYDDDTQTWIEMLCYDDAGGANWWTDVNNNWAIEGPIETKLATATGGQQLQIAGEKRGNLDDVLNVNVWNEQIYEYVSKADARAAVPANKRKLGGVITYLIDGMWYTEQFIGSSTSTWTTTESDWKVLGPVSVSQNIQTGHTDINIGGNTYPVPSVEETNLFLYVKNGQNTDLTLLKKAIKEIYWKNIPSDRGYYLRDFGYYAPSNWFYGQLRNSSDSIIENKHYDFDTFDGTFEIDDLVVKVDKTLFYGESSRQTYVYLSDGCYIDAKLFNIADGAITTPKIADSAITTPKIADSAITTPKIADGAVTNDKIQTNSIDNEKLKSSINVPNVDISEQGIITPNHYWSSANNNAVESTLWCYITFNVLPGEIYKVTSKSGQNARLWIILDGNGNILSYSSDSSALSIKSETIQIPTNGTTLIINAYYNTSFSVIKYSVEIDAEHVYIGEEKIKEYIDRGVSRSSNILYDKILVCCGDSITFGADMDQEGIAQTSPITVYQSNGAGNFSQVTADFRKTYGYQIAERNNMVFYNAGISGSTMQGLADKNGFSLENGRYTKLPDNIDYLTIWFGWNDTAYGTLGTINDLTNESYFGGYNVVMPYLINKYPYTKIALIVPFGTDVSHRQAVRDLANKWGVACFDMYQGGTPLYYGKEPSVGVNASIVTSNQAKFQANGAHPNFKGHRQIGDMLEHFLRGI